MTRRVLVRAFPWKPKLDFGGQWTKLKYKKIVRNCISLPSVIMIKNFLSGSWLQKMYTLQRLLFNYCWWSSFKDQLLNVPSYSIELHRTLWLTLLRCIREVPGSNLGPETCCPDWRFNALMRMERAVRWGFDFVVHFSGKVLVCNGRFWVRISSRCRIGNNTS
jgi:hypothetical protein